jgi:D-alanyl-D-alanine carboxypeptidase
MNRLVVFILFSVSVLLYQTSGFGAFAKQGLSDQGQAFIDANINAFMLKYGIPGLSIAIAKDNEFILAKAYGYSNDETKQSLNTAHQFRIASLSKPITAVAIMTLVEQHKLSLDDRVFGSGGLLSMPYPADNHHVGSITVRHLLEHSAAPEWTNDNKDPMFRYQHLNKKTLVKQILETRMLKLAPGSKYAYSNFGYCVLGLVIEKLSGLSYEQYVKQAVLTPAGTNSFMLGGKRPGLTPLEVTYHAHSSSDPYGFPVRRMDAHGGWIANAIDVVKFLQHTDAHAVPADLISSGSIKTMTTPSALNNNYALGWNVNQYNNWWHIGSLPGTAAIMVRSHQGYNWAILTNKNSDKPEFMNELDSLTWKLLNGAGLPL